MRPMRKFLLPLPIIAYFLISTELSDSAEPNWATYDAATGACQGAPQGNCKIDTIATDYQEGRRIHKQSTTPSGTCQRLEGPFGRSVKALLTSTSSTTAPIAVLAQM